MPGQEACRASAAEKSRQRRPAVMQPQLFSAKCVRSSDFLYHGSTTKRGAPRDGGPYGKCNRKSRAYPEGALDLDGSAVRFDDFARNSEPEPSSLGRSIGLVAGLEEFLEDVRQLFCRNSHSRIANCETHLILGAFDEKLHCATAIGELECIREKIAEHFVDAVFIPENMRRRLAAANNTEVDLALKCQHLERCLERMKESIEIYLPALELAAARFEPADVEQSLHQPCK